MRGWIYTLKRNIRKNIQIKARIACLVRKNVPVFDRRRKA